MTSSAVMDWLLAGDVAVAFQTSRDLLGRGSPELQSRIATEGHGAALLAARGAGGHWGRGFYQPKWTSSHYTLLELRNLGLSTTTPAPRETVAMILTSERGPDGGLNPAGGVRNSDACINGMALNYASYFGADPEHLAGIVDFLLSQQMPDGGFNCQRNRSGARHSSVHTTLSVVEGVTQYMVSGYTYRADELSAVAGDGVEFLLRHHLYRSERTAEPIHPELTRLHHPARWHYDILRCLDAFAEARVPYDPRMDEAIAILCDRRRPDGRWAANRRYPGVTHVPTLRAGTPSPWVTLIALRVLRAYGERDLGPAHR